MIYLICLLWFVVGFGSVLAVWLAQGGPILRKDLAVCCFGAVFGPLALIPAIFAIMSVSNWWEVVVWNRPKRSTLGKEGGRG